jgi:ankyrin repeat protein
MHSLVRALLDAGADPNAQIQEAYRLGPDGSPFEMARITPFFLAAVSADVELMRLLERYEADPTIQAGGGSYPLMAAARAACTGSCAFQGRNKTSNAEDTVKAVVEIGAAVNTKNNYGETPWSMDSVISQVLRYTGLYGVHKSTAAMLEGYGAMKVTRDEMDQDAPPPVQ